MEQYVQERDGGYYVAGTRIALDSVDASFQERCLPRKRFALASPDRVFGECVRAITFYLAHRDDVEAYLRDQERLS